MVRYCAKWNIVAVSLQLCLDCGVHLLVRNSVGVVSTTGEFAIGKTPILTILWSESLFTADAHLPIEWLTDAWDDNDNKRIALLGTKGRVLTFWVG